MFAFSGSTRLKMSQCQMHFKQLLCKQCKVITEKIFTYLWTNDNSVTSCNATLIFDTTDFLIFLPLCLLAITPLPDCSTQLHTYSWLKGITLNVFKRQFSSSLVYKNYLITIMQCAFKLFTGKFSYIYSASSSDGLIVVS